ncbi:hypothetical protein F7C95_00750 [Opitutia bacterium ISCC 51]|nr:hypothetical protein F7C95_00750 [Opitutae bacterium ISCC 51]QXD28543.1 hypothetical protein GA003_00745 [Opitutae bacterium ISCC 52]
MLIKDSVWFFLSAVTVGLILSGCAAEKPDYSAILEEMELSELAATFNEEKTKQFAPPRLKEAGEKERRAAAVLGSLDLNGSRQEMLQQWASHPIQQFLQTAMQPNWMEKDKPIIDAFEKRLAQPIEQRITTGYNIMPENRWPQFDPAKTILYGHNDLKHARQLYALCYSEGMRPRVSFLHKRSAFLFRDDWGEPSVPLVQLNNGDRLVTAQEHDLCIEFEASEDVDRFYDLVTRYAKKDTEDEAGLIHDAWWQPFYRTFQPNSFGNQLTLLLVRYEGYRTNLMSMPEEASEKKNKLEAMHSDWEVEAVDIWVNPAFYRFQLGDYR